MDPQPYDEEKKIHMMEADKNVQSYSELTMGKFIDQKKQKIMGNYSGDTKFRLSLLTSFQFIQ